MSLMMMRAAILAQGGGTAPPVDIGSLWQLDAIRDHTGYTLSDGNQTAVNTSGGSNFQRWVPTAKAILPSDGRRYWEVLCAASGATSFDGYMGVASAEQHAQYPTTVPIFMKSIAYRGNGTIWSNNSTTSSQRITGLPTYGAGDVLMFVFDPAAASLWVGKNGVWRNDPSGAATWTSAPSTAFYPQIHGRNPNDGGTLRAQPSQFSYPVPPGVRPLGYEDPDLRIFQSQIFLELGSNLNLSIGQFEAWLDLSSGPRLTSSNASLFLDLGAGTRLTSSNSSLFLDLGGGPRLTSSNTALYIEVELP